MITEKDAKYIAGLARIHLRDDEARTLTENLENILGYVQKLNTLDVSGIKPTSHALPINNIFRQDKVTQSLTQDEALSISVEKQDGAFKVPKVIE